MELKETFLKKRVSISIAESLTSGLLQDYFGRIPGASKFYFGGLTAYNIKQKVDLLEVEWEHAYLNDCISPQVAREMALGACKLFGSKIGIGTTGNAEVVNGEKPNAYYAICIKGDVDFFIEKRFEADLSRNLFREAVVMEVLLDLNSALMSL